MPRPHRETPHQADAGPFWLKDKRIAGMIVEALRHGDTVRQLYALYAWVIMPNHVDFIGQFAKNDPLSDVMRDFKRQTAIAARCRPLSEFSHCTCLGGQKNLTGVLQ